MDTSTLDLVGCAEIADRLDVQVSTVNQWRYRGVMPEPTWKVSNTPIWRWRDILKWAKETGRYDTT